MKTCQQINFIRTMRVIGRERPKIKTTLAEISGQAFHRNLHKLISRCDFLKRNICNQTICCPSKPIYQSVSQDDSVALTMVKIGNLHIQYRNILRGIQVTVSAEKQVPKCRPIINRNSSEVKKGILFYIPSERWIRLNTRMFRPVFREVSHKSTRVANEATQPLQKYEQMRYCCLAAKHKV